MLEDVADALGEPAGEQRVADREERPGGGLLDPDDGVPVAGGAGQRQRAQRELGVERRARRVPETQIQGGDPM